MPKVHRVEKARKDNPEHGIRKGDTYYWWSFRRGGKRYSKKPPLPSQLTQSEYLSTLYGVQEKLGTLLPATEDDCRDRVGEIKQAADDIRVLGEEQTEKYDNMPENLQESNTGQLLQDRAETCERIADELENAASDADGLCDEVEEEGWDLCAEEIIDLISNIDWSTE